MNDTSLVLMHFLWSPAVMHFSWQGSFNFSSCVARSCLSICIVCMGI